MISGQLVVMPMDVHVYVKLELKMMGLVTRLIIKAIICTDLVHLVSVIVILPTENVDFTLENNRYNMKGIRIDVIFTSTATTTTTMKTTITTPTIPSAATTPAATRPHPTSSSAAASTSTTTMATWTTLTTPLDIASNPETITSFPTTMIITTANTRKNADTTKPISTEKVNTKTDGNGTTTDISPTERSAPTNRELTKGKYTLTHS